MLYTVFLCMYVCSYMYIIIIVYNIITADDIVVEQALISKVLPYVYNIM